MENKNKKQRGITLISLVVTIVVMLILSGIAIGIVTGGNGILSNAKKSVREVQEAKLVDMLRTAEKTYKINNDVKTFTSQTLREELLNLKLIDGKDIDFVVEDEKMGILKDTENGIAIYVTIDEDYELQITGI